MSSPCGRSAGSPSTVSDASSPASRTCATSSSTRRSDGCGASSAPSSRLRRMPSIRCSSITAWRPVSSMPASTSRSRSGFLPSTRRTAPACSTITDTLCATASCSSRAIRARSSATAVRASSSATTRARLVPVDDAADAPRDEVEADLRAGLRDPLDPAGGEVDRDVGEPDPEAGERGAEAQLVRDGEEQDQLGQERRERVGVVGRVVRERLRDHDRGQRGKRIAAPQRDRGAVDQRGRQPAARVVARRAPRARRAARSGARSRCR